jgi:hypothetical protein
LGWQHVDIGLYVQINIYVVLYVFTVLAHYGFHEIWNFPCSLSIGFPKTAMERVIFFILLAATTAPHHCFVINDVIV